MYIAIRIFNKVYGDMTRFTKLLLAVLTAVLLIGCAGARTFHEYARAGDTTIVAAAYKQRFSA